MAPQRLTDGIAIPICDNGPVLLWHIGDVLRKVRDTQGLTRKDVAARSGVRQNTIGDVESLKSDFQRTTLEKIAKALDVTPEYLWAKIPHDPELCPARVTSAVTLPDDDVSRDIAAVWKLLDEPDRALILSFARRAAMKSSERHTDDDTPGSTKGGRPT